MHTISYTETRYADKNDIGKIILMDLGSTEYAIEESLKKCIDTYNGDTGAEINCNDVEDHVDPCYLMSGDLVALAIVE